MDRIRALGDMLGQVAAPANAEMLSEAFKGKNSPRPRKAVEKTLETPAAADAA